MKFLYTAFLLIFCAPLISQNSQIIPVQGNPVLRSHVAKEDARKAKEIKSILGHNPLESANVRVAGDCPPALPFGENIVETGKTITVTLDTFGLVGVASDTIFTVLTDPAPMFGTAVLLDNTIQLRYTANDGLTGLNEETILVELSLGVDKDTIATTFTIKRKGETIIMPTEVLNPEDTRTVCLDGFLNFSSPLSCSEFLPCIDDYPGEGDQFFYFSSFLGVDTCVIYNASRFPGVDTVCVMVCDELAVCDEFKIPFEILGETLEVTPDSPFFDDFSSYTGPYPTPDLWLDRDVYVNTTLADNPPSVGFVTFDGLNRRGQPYDIVNSGVGDKLTSKAMDLSAFGANDPLALRYFVAPKGYGQEPEPTDTLKVEFLNDQGEWIQVAFENGIDVPISTVPPFEFRGIEIDNPQFLHDAFQFRFVANVSPGGYGDWWHVDYVYLGNVGADVPYFSDVAFSQIPSSILKNYTSMPLRHLQADVENELRDEIESNFYNLFENPRAISESEVLYEETSTGTPIGTPFTVVDAANIAPGVPESYVEDIIGLSDIQTDLENLTIDTGTLQTTFWLKPSDQDVLFEDNDTVRLNTKFSNYFAHDDGTAEQAYFIFQVQGYEQVAQRFHANVEDELHAVQFMFPHFSIGELDDQFFTLKIWVDEDGDGELTEDDEVFSRELLQPFFPDAVYDTLQGFTTYILDDFTGTPQPVDIPAGKDFYVGWQFTTGAALSFAVGLDVQNDCNCVLENLDGTSFTEMTYDGALMVRPVFEPQPFNTSSGTADVAPTKLPLTIYPNPTSGLLNLKLEEGEYEDYKLLIFNQLGQVIAQPISAPTIDIGEVENGMYYLQISDNRTGGHFIKRFIFER